MGQTLQIRPIQGNSYTVKRGDTLYSIAREYNVSVKDLKEVNNLNTDVLYIGQELLIPSEVIDDITDDVVDNIYVVQKGDSLYSISRKYKTTVQELIDLNNLDNNTLKIGQKLIVPSIEEETYIVQKGDTLWSISKKYNVSVNSLKEKNNLKDNMLSINQQLIIP